MLNIIEIILAFIICGAVVVLLWFTAGTLYLPVKKCGDRAVAVIPVGNEEETLENTVKGILWLNESGIAKLQIILVCDNAQEHDIKAACLLSEKNNGITFCRASDLPDLLKEM